MALNIIKLTRVIPALSALLSIVGTANSAAISGLSGSLSASNILARAHAGPDATSNNPHSVAPDNDTFRVQTPSSDLCKDKGHDESGTWFCSQVDQVLYTKVSGRGSGTYEAVTFMDTNTGRCDKATRAWSGELAPFNEPISLHFHGPLHLKQVAFYQPKSDGSYSRKGFYHAQSQTAEGITFMGNFGGTAGSGVFTPTFGNSLSFVNSRGDGGASQPTILADTTVSDTADFSMFTSDPCSDGSCGYIQPGAAARKGFPGPNRMFLFEFSMPHSPPNADGSDPSDKPALWLLNARIPYTQQYDKCSCWNFGCGEFDIFEVVNKHDEKALSTFHLNPLGFGDPNYFRRPSDGPIKVALFMDGTDGGRMSVKVLGRSDGARFGGVLSAGEVNELKKKSEGRVSEYEIRWPAV